jgi:hypothetical protein
MRYTLTRSRGLRRPLSLSSLIFVSSWAPQVRDKLGPQTFAQEIPWPPMLVLQGSRGGALCTQSGLDERFCAFQPTLKRPQYHSGGAGMGGDHWAKYKHAKRLFEYLKESKPNDISDVTWLTREKLQTWRSQQWAKKVMEWCDKHSITWVNKAEKEKEMLREDARREKEVRPLHVVTQRSRSLHSATRKRRGRYTSLHTALQIVTCAPREGGAALGCERAL